MVARRGEDAAILTVGKRPRLRPRRGEELNEITKSFSRCDREDMALWRIWKRKDRMREMQRPLHAQASFD